MKKVININFQGRVIPIEESAHETLKQYIESLSKFFANEEGKEEIINDIEGRIAELFAETLKKGSTCISDDDVNKIISSIGRPEDFATDEINIVEETTSSSYNAKSNFSAFANNERERQRLYRDQNDKVLGGVCGGIANYLRVDSSIIRILFVLLGFGGGTGILIYFLLWIILPSKPLQANLTKRLYRNADEKVIGGVASGLAAYFDIAVWIPRLIFCFPLVIGIINSLVHNIFFDFEPFDSFPSFYFGSFGGSLTLIYMVLWAVLPEATTASEKLEMRGSKVDLNSIKNTIQDDLENFKTRAEKAGKNMSEQAKQWGSNFNSEQFVREVNASARSGGQKLGHAIAIFFKAFFLFIAGMLAFALLILLINGFFGGINLVPIKNFFVYSETQNVLFWLTISCFIVVPIIALLVWIARRLLKAKRYSRAISVTFGILWTIGFVAFFALIAVVFNNFNTKSAVEQDVTINQPSKDKLYITVAKSQENYYSKNWLGSNVDIDDASFYGINDDSLFLRNVRVGVFKSPDSLYHIKLVKFCRGNNAQTAKTYAANIVFTVKQNDSVITLPNGFIATKHDKFRNQQVMVVIEVPEGKRIQLSSKIDIYDWFEIEHNHKKWRTGWDNSWNNTLSWDSDVEMIMKNDDLKPTHNIKKNTDDVNEELRDIEEQKRNIEEQKRDLEQQKRDLEKEQKEKNNSVKAEAATPNNQVFLGNIMVDRFSI